MSDNDMKSANAPQEEGASGDDFQTTEIKSAASQKSADKPEPEKKPGGDEGWITAEMSRAKPAPPVTEAPASTAAPAPAAAPVMPVVEAAAAPQAPKQADAWSFAPAAPAAAAPAASAPSGGPSASASTGSSGIGGLLEKVGIKDAQTQKWVLIGGGIVLFLCCACSCVVAIFASPVVLTGILGN